MEREIKEAQFVWTGPWDRIKSAVKKDKKSNQRISPKAVNFLILLRQFPVNVSLDLVKLQLDAESFAFFMLQSALRQTDT